MPEVLTTNEVAQLLRVHPKTIYHLARAGKIPGAQIGGKWRFLKDEIIAMMRLESMKAKEHKPVKKQKEPDNFLYFEEKYLDFLDELKAKGHK